MNISLTPELETFVEARVTSGRYNSPSEVVREALRLLEEHENTRALQLEEFRSQVDRRLASLDSGKGVDGEAVFAELRKKSEQHRRKRASSRPLRAAVPAAPGNVDREPAAPAF
jgi:antitoxin ParD1/3/4